MNKEEGSAPSAEALEAWCKLHSLAAWTCKAKRVALARAPTGATRAAYAHDQTEGVCQEWRLDHIFYTKRTLQLEGLWSTLEEERASAGAGLPSLTCPSDHLPVAACFRPLTPPKLPAPEVSSPTPPPRPPRSHSSEVMRCCRLSHAFAVWLSALASVVCRFMLSLSVSWFRHVLRGADIGCATIRRRRCSSASLRSTQSTRRRRCALRMRYETSHALRCFVPVRCAVVRTRMVLPGGADGGGGERAAEPRGE